VRTHGFVYAVPPFLDPEELVVRRKLCSHPDVVSASTLELLKVKIDEGARPCQPEVLGSYEGYRLVQQRGVVYGIPMSAGRVDLSLEEDCRRARLIHGESCLEVIERIRGLREAVPIEFAGWLPIFEFSGNCGQHPQFAHTAEPPAGYSFTCSSPPGHLDPTADPQRAGRLLRGASRILTGLWWFARPFVAVVRSCSQFKLRDQIRVLAAIMGLFVILLRKGAKLRAIFRFLQSRHFHSQLLLAHYRGPVFLTSMPYTYGQNPWVVEIEDPTTLFYPLIQNGETAELSIPDSPYFPIIKTLLEADACKGILTHMRSTAKMVAALFASEIIRKKIHYTPLGVKLPERWQRHEEDETEPLDLLFINSWCQVPANFFVRGGLDVLEAFAILHRRFPRLRLTMRTDLPPLDDHYLRIIDSNWVRLIDRFLPDLEMDALLAESHIFLLPSARVHIVSLLQAMSYGLAVVSSDGWGIQEYLAHERNGLIVEGRYGRTSWTDEKVGMLREDYEPMYTADPRVVAGLVEAVSRLVQDRKLRKRLGRSAREDVRTTYNLENWNGGLKRALDQALAGSDARPPRILPGEAMAEFMANSAKPIL
jgi:glycosyltransferase involved in cell wall biosynthesis